MTKPDAQQAERAAITKRGAIESFRTSVLADLAKRSDLGGRPSDTLARLDFWVRSSLDEARRIERTCNDKGNTPERLDKLRAELRERLVAIAALAQLAAREIGIEDEIPF